MSRWPVPSNVAEITSKLRSMGVFGLIMNETDLAMARHRQCSLWPVLLGDTVLIVLQLPGNEQHIRAVGSDIKLTASQQKAVRELLEK